MKNFGKIKLVALSTALVACLALPFAYAQSKGGHGGKQRGGWHHGRHGEMGFRNLNLTDAQKTQMKQLRDSYKERNQPLHTELRTKMQELRQAQQGGGFNEALAAQKLAEIAPLRAKLMAEQFKLRQDSMAVLTPEQKTQLDQQREQFKAKREQFKAKRAEKQNQVQ